MINKGTLPATILVNGIAAINILGNLFGVLLTFIYFGLLEPLAATGSPAQGLQGRTIVVLIIAGVVVAIIGPINAGWVIPLVREAKKRLPAGGGEKPQTDVRLLRLLAGRLVNLPLRLAATTLAGWVLGAIVFSALPHIFPGSYPWPHTSSHKISAWMVFVGAPITMSWIYFSQERWLRIKMNALFPAEALATVPDSFRINVLPKMLVVSLVITCIPLIMVSHVTLHQIHEIQAGRQSIDVFLAHMPTVIWFLLGVFLVLAVGLSLFMAKSVSEPLAQFESVMEDVRRGDLDVSIPVVSNDEIGRTGEGFNRMVSEHKELDSIRDTFGRYLSKEVVDEILKSPGGVDLRGELRDITILVSDLRGFTRIAESLEPRQVLELINRYLEKMTDIVMKHGGTIDEFTGDGILVFFGAPRAMPDHCQRAVECALEMQAAMNNLNAENLNHNLPELHMGIGINTGQLIVGNIGSERRMKYGAVGSPINLAFRIEAQTARGEILVSPEVSAQIDGVVGIRGPKEASLKGVDSPVTLYSVHRLAET